MQPRLSLLLALGMILIGGCLQPTEQIVARMNSGSSWDLWVTVIYPHTLHLDDDAEIRVRLDPDTDQDRPPIPGKLTLTFSSDDSAYDMGTWFRLGKSAATIDHSGRYKRCCKCGGSHCEVKYETSVVFDSLGSGTNIVTLPLQAIQKGWFRTKLDVSYSSWGHYGRSQLQLQTIIK